MRGFEPKRSSLRAYRVPFEEFANLSDQTLAAS
jgi:hypothetical protein